jgi:hypothetical protein
VVMKVASPCHVCTRFYREVVEPCGVSARCIIVLYVICPKASCKVALPHARRILDDLDRPVAWLHDLSHVVLCISPWLSPA